MKTLLHAAWIAPMDRPAIRDGAVVFDRGIILDVGPAKALRQQHPDANPIDLGDATILPGLVNAHTHMELSNVIRPAVPGPFVDWIIQLMAQTPRPGQVDANYVVDATRQGVEQCLRFGVTTIGDITKQAAFTRQMLCNGPLRVVSYGEIQAMAQRRSLLEERFATASDCGNESSMLRIGVSPHAPYTVEPDGFTRCLTFARQSNRPLATHLAENPEEAEFLLQQTGPFRRLWEVGVNAWDESVPKFAGGPIRFAKAIGLLDYPSLLAHVNYCDDDELSLLAEGNASVVYCPRTHAYFGHPSHRWREMLARGINVAVGTDSCASSPDLDLVDDLRLLHRIAPEVPVHVLWQMATVRAAKAIQMDQVGSISPGRFADMTVFSAGKGDPLQSILESDSLPMQVWIAGVPVPRACRP